ncbi:MAG: GNAT family N-acetyltransferase [Cyclobacteriaceae bacterium]
MSNYRFSQLSENDFDQMHRSFLEAFNDYPVKFDLTSRQFEYRMLNKLNINFDVSYGAFSGEKLAAFLFHTINNYKGRETAYNGGTGVIAGHRGRNLIQYLYKMALTDFQKIGVKSILLEVLENNAFAIKLYEEVGFNKTKTLNCFKKEVLSTKPKKRNIEIKRATAIQDNFQSFGDYTPTFGDTLEQVIFNLEDESILTALIDGNLIGYLIFQAKIGRITQIAVSKDYRRLGAGSALIYAAEQVSAVPLTVMNVDCNYSDLHTFLINQGFRKSLTQFEMELKL